MGRSRTAGPGGLGWNRLVARVGSLENQVPDASYRSVCVLVRPQTLFQTSGFRSWRCTPCDHPLQAENVLSFI